MKNKQKGKNIKSLYEKYRKWCDTHKLLPITLNQYEKRYTI